MYKYLLLAIGGAIGTICRYAAQGVVQRATDAVFPWGTLTVNLSGSLIIGFLWGMHEVEIISPNMRVFLFIGLLGGYTTFSSFSLESLNLLREGEVKYFVMNMLASNILGVALAFGGFVLSKNIFKL